MAITHEELKPIARSHSGAIVSAIILCTGLLIETGLYISGQFEKPRAYATATYNPDEEALVPLYAFKRQDQAYERYWAMETRAVEAEAKAQALQDKLDGKKPTPTPCPTTRASGIWQSYPMYNSTGNWAH